MRKRFADGLLLLPDLDGGDDPRDLFRHGQIGPQHRLRLLRFGLQHHSDHFLQHLLLAFEVIVTGALGDPRCVDDLVHAGLLVSLGYEHPVRDPDQLLPPFFPFFHGASPFAAAR